MFENLDDPVPPNLAPVDGVIARGRRLRMHRRMVAGAAVLFVLAGGIAGAAALQGGGEHRNVLVTNPPTSATVDETTSVPESTSSTTDPAAAATSTSSTSPTADPVILPSTTTTTTQPPHDPHDLSMVTVTYPDTFGPSTCVTESGGRFSCDHIMSLDSGTSATVPYTVTNNGSWTVQFGGCVSHEVGLWSDILREGQGPSSEGIWPQPYPSRSAVAAPDPCADIARTVAPGQSVSLTETVLAGFRNAAGDMMPAPPGQTFFVPSFLPPCAQPCDTYLPYMLAVGIWPPGIPATSAYVITVKSMQVHAAPGASAQVEMTYTNPLAFSVRMPVLGPCWTVKSGSAQVECTGGRPEIIVGPHSTVDVVGTIWARRGFTATGAPLAAGKYGIDLGDLHGSLYAVGSDFPVLTVTAT